MSQQSLEVQAAEKLYAVCKKLPLHISDNSIFCGTQNDAFSPSYALIHPSFKVEDFKGYCDPVAIFSDIEFNGDVTVERVAKVRSYYENTVYVRELKKAYEPCALQTEEALFFVEQVTGHVVPDFSLLVSKGLKGLTTELEAKLLEERNEVKRQVYLASLRTLEGAAVLAGRYSELATALANEQSGERSAELCLMSLVMKKLSNGEGADNLYEAMQYFLFAWMLMCLEQCPNPYALSPGLVDRFFESYRAKENVSREQSSALFECFLAWYNVGDRSWAISQNLLLSGLNEKGTDATNTMTYSILDAFYKGRFPQPILSVRLHGKTPDKLYEELGKFFFSEGHLTPSLFNDESVLRLLTEEGIPFEDAACYAIAGCQEPLITGKDNGNTTNSWLNLAKVLEIVLADGYSTITGRKIGFSTKELTGKTMSPRERIINIRELFYKELDAILVQMVSAANACSRALSYLRTPFLSLSMGSLETGYDLRDAEHQGTRYNGSGCLIHGLSVVADSFEALQDYACNTTRTDKEFETLIMSLEKNYEGEEALKQYLESASKFGNNLAEVDSIACDVCREVSKKVAACTNYLGNHFRPDWATPSTHLLYGYWTGATPDGRKSREELNYGIDPLFGESTKGMNFRILSTGKLPYECMRGGVASHLGINPKLFKDVKGLEAKGLAFRERVIKPFFRLDVKDSEVHPFYLYVNVTTAETLRKVLAAPEKYAPSGVYIMRIHGTFVNFLDLSPAIQEDIILRLDCEVF